jgi:hypothetical protein
LKILQRRLNNAEGFLIFAGGVGFTRDNDYLNHGIDSGRLL